MSLSAEQREEMGKNKERVQSDFKRRKTGANAYSGEHWPWPIEPHKFVPWPDHVACAWCCGAPSNKKWHIK